MHKLNTRGLDKKCAELQREESGAATDARYKKREREPRKKSDGGSDSEDEERKFNKRLEGSIGERPRLSPHRCRAASDRLCGAGFRLPPV